MQDTVDQAYVAVPYAPADVIEDPPGCRAGRCPAAGQRPGRSARRSMDAP